MNGVDDRTAAALPRPGVSAVSTAIDRASQVLKVESTRMSNSRTTAGEVDGKCSGSLVHELLPTVKAVWSVKCSRINIH
jgi:hypothetical protein